MQARGGSSPPFGTKREKAEPQGSAFSLPAPSWNAQCALTKQFALTRHRSLTTEFSGRCSGQCAFSQVSAHCAFQSMLEAVQTVSSTGKPFPLVRAFVGNPTRSLTTGSSCIRSARQTPSRTSSIFF